MAMVVGIVWQMVVAMVTQCVTMVMWQWCRNGVVIVVAKVS